MQPVKSIYLKVIVVLMCFVSMGNAQSYRNVYQWPFSEQSIWNTPIGSNAVYLDAQIQQAFAAGMTVDEEIISLDRNAPMIDVYINNAQWNPSLNRCPIEGPLMFSVPLPTSFIISPATWDGSTPNSQTALLMPDGVSLRGTQPLARCQPGFATSRWQVADVNIYSEGSLGMHGGSKLSALGGTLRLGELRPSSGPIKHSLKVNLFGAKNYNYTPSNQGYRWPAIAADSYAPSNYGTQRTNPIVEACRMGALLALKPDFDINAIGFETEPAKILAQAFKDYGAYIVDDTAWDVYALCTEWSPNGKFTEQFQTDWGFPMSVYNKNNAWARDMDKIFLNLHVVDNNSPTAIGGGGTPRAALAPPFEPDCLAGVNGTSVPVELESTVLSGTSVKLDWMEVHNATGYAVEYKLASESAWSSPLPATTTTLTVNGLSEGETYDWRLSATCPTFSSNAAAANFTTQAATSTATCSTCGTVNVVK